MAVTSKNIEILWGRYQSEGVSKGVSVSLFFEANGISYHVFEKWYKKRYRQPDVVECQVEMIPFRLHPHQLNRQLLSPLFPQVHH